MEEHFFFVQNDVVNVKGVCNFTFAGSNSAIISDSCDYVGTQLFIAVEFSFPRILK